MCQPALSQIQIYVKYKKGMSLENFVESVKGQNWSNCIVPNSNF